MAVQITYNNAKATIASGIASGATSLTLATGKGALFPALSGGDWFMLTLTQAVTETSWEIVKVTARSGDVLTIVRAQEGTTAAAWAAADKAELRLTAGLVNRLATLDDAQTFTGQKTLTNPVINGFTGDTSAINIGSGQFVKNTAGNVGLGITAPNYKLSLTSNQTFWESGLNPVVTGADQELKIISEAPGGGGRTGTIGVYNQGARRLQVDSAGNVLVTSAACLGYGVGAGGTVTQATSKSTAVTLNKPTGKITLNGASLADGATVSFQLNNSLIVAGDTVSLSLFSSTATLGAYRFWIDRVDVGSTYIFVQNYSGGALAEAFSIQFNVHKGVVS